MTKHKHDFIPVDVAWKDYWGKIHDDESPVPGHVISACACGAVKLVKARLVEEKVKEFHSMKKVMEEYFPRAVKLRKLKMETPKEFGSRIVSEILSSAKELLEEDNG